MRSGVRRIVFATAIGAACVPLGAGAQARDPLIRNPVLLNIGYVCRWQPRCVERQEKAMNRALDFTRRHNVPIRKIQLCNRNAGRGGARVDWIGFNNCVRNRKI